MSQELLRLLAVNISAVAACLVTLLVASLVAALILLAAFLVAAWLGLVASLVASRAVSALCSGAFLSLSRIVIASA